MLYDSFGIMYCMRQSLQLGVGLVGSPKKDRKQSIKNKTIGPSVFTLIFGFVALSVCPFCPDFPLYLNNYFIKRIYMHIIRMASMRGLRLCALFVVSTYISRVINENVRKIAKTKIEKYKFMR